MVDDYLLPSPLAFYMHDVLVDYDLEEEDLVVVDDNPRLHWSETMQVLTDIANAQTHTKDIKSRGPLTGSGISNLHNESDHLYTDSFVESHISPELIGGKKKWDPKKDTVVGFADSTKKQGRWGATQPSSFTFGSPTPRISGAKGPVRWSYPLGLESSSSPGSTDNVDSSSSKQSSQPHASSGIPPDLDKNCNIANNARPAQRRASSTLDLMSDPMSPGAIKRPSMQERRAASLNTIGSTHHAVHSDSMPAPATRRLSAQTHQADHTGGPSNDRRSMNGIEKQQSLKDFIAANISLIDVEEEEDEDVTSPHHSFNDMSHFDEVLTSTPAASMPLRLPLHEHQEESQSSADDADADVVKKEEVPSRPAQRRVSSASYYSSSEEMIDDTSAAEDDASIDTYNTQNSGSRPPTPPLPSPLRQRRTLQLHQSPGKSPTSSATASTPTRDPEFERRLPEATNSFEIHKSKFKRRGAIVSISRQACLQASISLRDMMQGEDSDDENDNNGEDDDEHDNSTPSLTNIETDEIYSDNAYVTQLSSAQLDQVRKIEQALRELDHDVTSRRRDAVRTQLYKQLSYGGSTSNMPLIGFNESLTAIQAPEYLESTEKQESFRDVTNALQAVNSEFNSFRRGAFVSKDMGDFGGDDDNSESSNPDGKDEPGQNTSNSTRHRSGSEDSIQDIVSVLIEKHSLGSLRDEAESSSDTTALDDSDSVPPLPTSLSSSSSMSLPNSNKNTRSKTGKYPRSFSSTMRKQLKGLKQAIKDVGSRTVTVSKGESSSSLSPPKPSHRKNKKLASTSPSPPKE